MSKAEKAIKKDKSKRILTFDLLRGYFLIVIILDHLQWFPNGLDWVSARGSLFVSAAEGFFLISGIVLGIVRGRKLIQKPFREAALLLLTRAVQLYVVSIVLMLLFTFIGWFFLGNPGLKPGIRPIDQPLWEILIGALSFQYLYGWADFLRLYSIFLFISPLALWLLRKKKWYVLLVGNIILWALFPLAATYTGHSTELLMPLAWQLIFFSGLTIGYYWEPLSNWWYKQPNRTRRWILWPILGIGGLTLATNFAIVTASSLGILPAPIAAWHGSLYPLFNKEALSPLRLLMFGCWFTFGFYIFKRLERYIVKLFGWILLPFGGNSLYVYILHAILLFFAHLILTPGMHHNVLINGAGTVLIIGLIWFALKKQFLFKIIPR